MCRQCDGMLLALQHIREFKNFEDFRTLVVQKYDTVSKDIKCLEAIEAHKHLKVSYIKRLIINCVKHVHVVHCRKVFVCSMNWSHFREYYIITTGGACFLCPMDVPKCVVMNKQNYSSTLKKVSQTQGARSPSQLRSAILFTLQGFVHLRFMSIMLEW